MTPEQTKKFNEMYQFMLNMRSSTTVPFDVAGALKARAGGITLTGSTKGASSEDQAVDEDGSATYSVLKSPDGFDQRVDNGTVKSYPYYT